jgi:endonuclease/exonuclease/phosphatase family metal-dependent hydrolase
VDAPARSGARSAAHLRDLSSLVPDRRRGRFDPEGRDPRRRPGELVALSWNVFHGRDAPPDPELYTLRSRLLRTTTRNATHVQVNRSLREEFAELIAATRWDVCLLQECPPAWASHIAEHSQASMHRVRTSRNWLSPFRRLIARHNPDLMGSWEGGSNLTLARLPWRIVETRSVLLNRLPARRLRERRRMALTRLVGADREVCVANLHLSTGPSKPAAAEARRAARIAIEWARGAPLLLGGDFNLRPRSSAVFDELCETAGLCGATDPDAIDHLLARGLEVIEAPRRWKPERRELEVPAGLERRRIRLSDHAPVEARFRVPAEHLEAAAAAGAPGAFDPGVR